MIIFLWIHYDLISGSANYDASENEMFKVLLKLANLSVVNNEPVSLDTHLINRGNNYSGGQNNEFR